MYHYITWIESQLSRLVKSVTLCHLFLTSSGVTTSVILFRRIDPGPLAILSKTKMETTQNYDLIFIKIRYLEYYIIIISLKHHPLQQIIFFPQTTNAN